MDPQVKTEAPGPSRGSRRFLLGVCLAAAFALTSTGEFLFATRSGYPVWAAGAMAVCVDVYVLAALQAGRDFRAALTVMGATQVAAHVVELVPSLTTPSGHRVPIVAPLAGLVPVAVLGRVHVLIHGTSNQPVPQPVSAERSAPEPARERRQARTRPAPAPRTPLPHADRAPAQVPQTAARKALPQPPHPAPQAIPHEPPAPAPHGPAPAETAAAEVRMDDLRAERSALVAELAAELRDDPDWRPDYPQLMEQTGKGRRWCEYAVRDARASAQSASDQEETAI